MKALGGYICVVVLRIPAVKYRPEYYEVNSRVSAGQVLGQLKRDKNVIDFKLAV
jgi:hypothetical protein